MDGNRAADPVLPSDTLMKLFAWFARLDPAACTILFSELAWPAVRVEQSQQPVALLVVGMKMPLFTELVFSGWRLLGLQGGDLDLNTVC